MRKLLLAGCLAAAALFAARPLLSKELPKELELFMDVMSYVRRDYVDEVPVKKLVQGALTGMLRSLDPYSQYLTEEAYKDLKVDTEGEFDGIGVEVSTKGGTLHVISALEDSPAAQAGVQAGDTIIKINDEAAATLSLDQAVSRLRGAPGSSVRLTLLRESESKLVEAEVPRANIKVKSIKEAKLLENNIGYIRLGSFQEKSGRDFENALRLLESQGMNGLVIDLRNNAGGLLTAAVDVADTLTPAGSLIVSTKGRVPEKTAAYLSKNKKPHRPAPLAVLINKGSASGSEIFAGAVQDHRLGRIFGQRSFGKGSVQSLVPLSDGSAIRVTTSKYYTPSGRTIHETGIQPDTVIEPTEDKSAGDPELKAAVQWIRENQKTRS